MCIQMYTCTHMVCCHTLSEYDGASRARSCRVVHQIMYNGLRLYADNLICMDLCCCSSSEALKLWDQRYMYIHRSQSQYGYISTRY